VNQLSANIASRGPTRFITDSDKVVQSSAERYQHSTLADSRFPRLSLPVFNNQRLSILCLCRIFISRIFHPLQHCATVSVSLSFHPCILGHFGAVVSFPAVVSCLVFSASPVIDGVAAPHGKGTTAPNFSVHVYCCQTVARLSYR